MKREILFKAKSLNDGWVEGLPLYLTEYGKDLGEIDGIQCNKTRDNYDVEPETVCQYVTNHNNKNIFSGDILRSINHYEGKKPYYIYHVVVWSEKHSCYLAKSKDSESDEIGNGTVLLWVYFRNANSMMIVGNIHDNN